MINTLPWGFFCNLGMVSTEAKKLWLLFHEIATEKIDLAFKNLNENNF